VRPNGQRCALASMFGMKVERDHPVPPARCSGVISVEAQVNLGTQMNIDAIGFARNSSTQRTSPSQ